MTVEARPENETFEQRLDQVEAALGLKAPAIEDRLDAIEATLGELSKKQSPRGGLVLLDYLIRIAGALMPVALLVIGFQIKDSVDLAIKERELSIKEARLKIDEAKALDGLLRNFRKSDIGVAEARRTALLILDYGNAGIRPLVQDLNVEQHRRVRAEAAASALKLHAVMGNERGTVCLLLGRVQGMTPPIFTPLGLERVAMLQQDLDCGALE